MQHAIEDLLLGLARLKGFTHYTLTVDHARTFTLEWQLGKVQVTSQAEKLVVAAWHSQKEVFQNWVPTDPEETLRVRIAAILHDGFVAITHQR